jgi:hypothetical protein
MIGDILGFIGDNASSIIPKELGLAAIFGGGAVFSFRKFLFFNVLMRFFPKVFVKWMINLGKSSNKFFEKKKASGSYEKGWHKAELKIIEAIDGFNAELKKN